MSKVFGYPEFDASGEMILTTYDNEYSAMNMDIRVYRMAEGERRTFLRGSEETAVLLLSGNIVFDWEDFSFFNEYEMSFRDLNRLYDFFSEQVHRRGYECMLYGSQYYLDTVWAHTDTRPIWLAQYNDYPSYEGQFEIWQLSDSGRIDGIDGNVDLNLLYLRQSQPPA